MIPAEAYSTIVQASISRDNLREAFDTAFLASAEIGEAMPEKPSTAAVAAELIKLRFFMKVRFLVDTNIPCFLFLYLNHHIMFRNTPLIGSKSCMQWRINPGEY